MRKAVMISIRPKWCEKIARGEKTIEVRKTYPKLKPPFKCYIYQTKNGKAEPELVIAYGKISGRKNVNGGTVIGEFVCDDIRCFGVPYPAFQNKMDKTILEQSCLSYDELHRYAYHDALYGWHISDLIIYDKPKKLSEFFNYDRAYENSMAWAFGEEEKRKPLTKPPQSWCYVEEV